MSWWRWYYSGREDREGNIRQSDENLIILCNLIFNMCIGCFNRNINKIVLIINGVSIVATQFHEIALVCMSLCVCLCLSVYPPLRALITGGIIWCDIDRV